MEGDKNQGSQAKWRETEMKGVQKGWEEREDIEGKGR